MIKVFTTNKNGKIELTKDELKNLLDEAYWDGYRAHNPTYTYTTPNWTPYKWSVTTASNSVTLDSNTITNGTVSTADAVSYEK
ncbi:MAG: hypothetical protein J6W84_03430 [Bacteroidales bacterium]|nr:hypothetical protein [Bacteroidales bacterium]